MTPAEQLITAYVEAARAVERWTQVAQMNQCPNDWMHTKNNRITTAGSTCTTCRNRLHAQHKIADAKQARGAAQAEMHRLVLNRETQRIKAKRVRVRTGRN